jgi:hypothetical protein
MNRNPSRLYVHLQHLLLAVSHKTVDIFTSARTTPNADNPSTKYSVFDIVFRKNFAKGDGRVIESLLSHSAGREKLGGIEYSCFRHIAGYEPS